LHEIDFSMMQDRKLVVTVRAIILIMVNLLDLGAVLFYSCFLLLYVIS